MPETKNSVFEAPYIRADDAIIILNGRSVRRFNKAEQSCSLSGFDELNVIKACTVLYQELDDDNRKIYLDLALLIYADVMIELGAKSKRKNLPTKKWVNDEILEKSNPVTQYIYTNEVYRKKDRLIEALESAVDKPIEFRRALNLWGRGADQYCDIVTDRTMIKAYEDAGVEYVKWVTQRDEKVCKHCGPLDGKVYPIAKAPPKKHYHCRCFLVPCRKDGKPWRIK